MQHCKLGNSDLELPVVTFGAWAIGGLFWGGTNDDEAIKAIQASIDHGVDAIDTAPIYGCGHSETIVGQAVRGHRDKVRILTKCGLRWDDAAGEFFFKIGAPDGDDVVCYKNVRADSIAHECEQSLRRLGTDVIDLYQIHWPSTSASAEETMGALLKLKSQGKIREIGVCNYTIAQIAEVCGFAPVVSDQVKYNLLERDIEKDTLPHCRQHGIGVIAYSPMALGLLSGRVTMERSFPATDIRTNHPWYQSANRRRVLECLEKVRPVADAHGLSLAQLAVAWVIAQPGVTTALVGARNATQAAENAAAAGCTLTPDEVAHIRSTFEALGGPVT